MSCQHICTNANKMINEFYVNGNYVEDVKILLDDFSTDETKESVLCNLPSLSGFTRCDVHKCMVENCDKSKLSPTFKFCKKHICFFTIDHKYCGEQTSDDNHYCPKHTCSQCSNAIDNIKTIHCRKHLEKIYCLFKDCQNSIPFDDSLSTYYFCEEHNDDKDYEEKHCKSKYCCDEKYFDSDYCSEHRCYFKNCHNERLPDDTEFGDLIFSSKYCSKHHLLNNLCVENYNVDLIQIESFMKIINFIDTTSIEQTNVKYRFLQNIYQKAVLYCN